MKNLVLLSLLLYCTYVSYAADVFCGLLRNHVLYDEMNVTNGLVVSMYDPGVIKTNTPSVLSFFTRKRPENQLIDGLQYANQRYMHIIGVSSDMEEFFHIHPVKLAKGIWVVTNVFKSDSIYHIWSDVKKDGIGYTFAHPPLFVGKGRSELAQKRGGHTNNSQFSFSEGVLTLTHSIPLLAKKTNWFVFSFTGENGKVELEPYLGSLIHVSAIREDAAIYQHSHPINPENADNIACYFILPEMGDYKLYVQFKPKGSTQLGEDGTVVAPFWVKFIDEDKPQKHPIQAKEAEERFRRTLQVEEACLFLLVFSCSMFLLKKMWYNNKR